HSHDHEPGGAKMGFADVPVAGTLAEIAGASWQYRVVALKDAFGTTTSWTAFKPKFPDGKLSASVRIRAGGWYRLEIRAVTGGQTVARESVEPIGVGEVFVIAGQSYADGHNDELMKVEGTSTEKYVANLTTIRESLAKEWKFAPPWLLAKSTLHPTVYNN